MSQIINAIPPNALLPVAGALVGWVGHMLWFRSERAHVAAGMARIRQFMRGNDEWLSGQQQRHAAVSSDPDVTGELVAVVHHELPALSDRPAEDEDEVGDEQPGEALSGAPARLWDRLWTWLTDLLADFADVFKSDERRAAEFWTATEPEVPTEPAAELEAPAEVPTQVEAEPVQIVRVNRYRDPGMTGQFPYVKVAGAPRHAAPEPEPEFPAINAAVPAPRDGGDN